MHSAGSWGVMMNRRFECGMGRMNDSLSFSLPTICKNGTELYSLSPSASGFFFFLSLSMVLSHSDCYILVKCQMSFDLVFAA